MHGVAHSRYRGKPDIETRLIVPSDKLAANNYRIRFARDVTAELPRNAGDRLIKHLLRLHSLDVIRGGSNRHMPDSIASTMPTTQLARRSTTQTHGLYSTRARGTLLA